MAEVNGFYRHFKGNYYKVLSLAKDSETTQNVVVYQALYGDFSLWVRSEKMFDETIERDGKTIKRFARVDYSSLPEHIKNNEEKILKLS
jgi:hypothetical protein